MNQRAGNTDEEEERIEEQPSRGGHHGRQGGLGITKGDEAKAAS